MNTNKNKVLVTGATGNTGGYAVKYLLEKQVPLRALVRQIDQRSDALAARGVEIVVGDLTNLESVHSAMKGISSALFVYPIASGLIDATAYFAQAALENGVSHIVNLSQFGANRGVKSHGAENHWIAERVFDRSGLPVTQLRPTLFAEWFLYQASNIKTKSQFYLPFGDARFAPIATEDIGRVIAAILADPGAHAGKSYDLFGPKILDMTEAAAIFSEALGRKISYIPIDSETFADKVRAGKNADPYLIQHLTSLGQDLKNGRPAGMNGLVEKLSGQPPMQLSEFIKRNKEAFA